MITVEHRFTLPAPPARAFVVLAQPENDPLWQSACRSATLHQAPCALGSHYDIVFDFLGRGMRFECEIIRHAPGESYAFKVVTGSFHYEGHYHFEAAAGDQTQVLWRFSAEPGSFFGLIPTGLIRKVLLSQFERDVPALQALCAQQPRT